MTTTRDGRTLALHYRLNRRARVAVELRGPLPLCTPAAKFTVRGRRGRNVLRFDGTVGRERLRPGEYLLGVRVLGTHARRWRVVRVLDDGAEPVRRRAAPIVDACAPESLRATTRLDGAAGGALPQTSRPESPARADDAVPVAVPVPETATAPAPQQAPPSLDDEAPASEVLGFDDVENATGDVPAPVAVAMLVLLLGSLGAVAIFVLRFLRGS